MTAQLHDSSAALQLFPLSVPVQLEMPAHPPPTPIPHPVVQIWSHHADISSAVTVTNVSACLCRRDCHVVCHSTGQGTHYQTQPEGFEHCVTTTYIKLVTLQSSPGHQAAPQYNPLQDKFMPEVF